MRILVLILAAFASHWTAAAEPKAKTAFAPPAIGQRDPEAPPEGRGPGGLDFGAWRAGPPQRISGAFAAEVARLAERGDLQASLTANGFACREPIGQGGRWVCARSALEGACGYDWTVTAAPQSAVPAARFTAHCLPATR